MTTSNGDREKALVPQSEQQFDLATHLTRQHEWSQTTFGQGTGTQRILDHIRKELFEIEADPADATEWIDLVMMAFDGALRAGHSPQQIIDTLIAKQAKNETRTWPDWRTADPNKAIEHDRSKDNSCEQQVGGPSDTAAALRDLYRGYVRLLESGRDRIIDFGGECDSLEVMEKGDPALIHARAAIAASKAAGVCEGPTKADAQHPFAALIDADGWEAASYVFGSAEDGYCKAELFIGDSLGDDGKQHHGLHIRSAEYASEEVVLLSEFPGGKIAVDPHASIFDAHWPEGLSINKAYELRCDDKGRNGGSWMRVFIANDNDVHVITQDWEEMPEQEPNPMPTLRCRTLFGGGRNMRSHQALLWLAQAIRLDNAERNDRVDARSAAIRG